MTLAFHEEVARRLREGRRLALATVIARQGSAPRAEGARMIVEADGRTAFSIGGGAFEALVIADAREALASGRSFEKEYRFREEGEGATGMVCGGSVRVFVEVVVPPEPLFVFGAGHVGRALARVAAPLGLRVIVVEDREADLRDAELPPGTERLLAGRGFAEAMPEIPAGAYVAIVTRCHKTDLAAVRHALGRGAAYVGLIGSRRKVATVAARAAEAGLSEADLAALRAPIGLPIGAETPEEIAVSIAAEIIAVRRGAMAADALRAWTPLARRRGRIA
ncbi:MAG TPA: XdhC/CoxI family protein [Candidatus Polarisedimenticolia bacterium]|jgi:xanthine dehydrogenase accessory factor|nr:XdhC/CoxI family protein [Candidatus Polarisedimenticolia bacterium]